MKIKSFTSKVLCGTAAAVFAFAVVLLAGLAVGGIFLLIVSVHAKESPLSSEFVSIVWTENAGLMRKNQRARRFFPPGNIVDPGKI